MANPRPWAPASWRPAAAAAVASDGAAVGWSRTPEPAAVARKRRPLPAPVRPLPRPPSHEAAAAKSGPAVAPSASAKAKLPAPAPARPLGGLLFLQAEVEAEMLASVQAEEEEAKARRAEAERKKAEEERKRIEAEKRRVEEERQKLEAEKKAEEERQKLEAEKRNAEYEKQKAAAEREQVEASKKLAEAEAAHAFQYMIPGHVGSALPATLLGARSPQATEASAQAARDLAAALRATGSQQLVQDKSTLLGSVPPVVANETRVAGMPSAFSFDQTARGVGRTLQGTASQQTTPQSIAGLGRALQGAASQHAAPQSIAAAARQGAGAQPHAATSSMAAMPSAQASPLEAASGLPLDPAVLRRLVEMHAAMGAVPLDPAPLLQMARAMSELEASPTPSSTLPAMMADVNSKPTGIPPIAQLPLASKPFSKDAMPLGLEEADLPSMGMDAQAAKTTSSLPAESEQTVRASAPGVIFSPSAAVTEPDPTLMRIRAGIAAGDTAAVKQAVLAAEQASVPIEPHVRSMLRQWLGEELPTLLPTGPAVQSPPGAAVAAESTSLPVAQTSATSVPAPLDLVPDPSVQAAMRATEEQLSLARAETARLEAQVREMQRNVAVQQQDAAPWATQSSPQASAPSLAVTEESHTTLPLAEPQNLAALAHPGAGVVISRGPVLRGQEDGAFDKHLQELFAVVSANEQPRAEEMLPSAANAAESAEPREPAKAADHAQPASTAEAAAAVPQQIANDGSFMERFLAMQLMQQEQALKQQQNVPLATSMATPAEHRARGQNQEDDEASPAKGLRPNPPDAEKAAEEDSDATMSPATSEDHAPVEEAAQTSPQMSHHAVPLQSEKQEDAQSSAQTSLPAGWSTEPEEKKPRRAREAWEYMKEDTWGAGNFFSFDSFK